MSSLSRLAAVLPQAEARNRSQSLLRASIPALGIGLVVAVFVIYYGLTRDHFFGDSYTYLAAGERLNASHPLYALSPGDRQVAILPPFWTAPLVSPPFIAVL